MSFSKTFFIAAAACAFLATPPAAVAQSYPGVVAPVAPANSGPMQAPTTQSPYNFGGGSAQDYGMQDNGGGATVTDNGTANDGQGDNSSFNEMYGITDDDSNNLYGYVNGQTEDAHGKQAESRREKAIIKAAIEKQRQIQQANIALRKREQAAVKAAAKRAAGKDKNDGTAYSASGGDNGDGYYGAPEVQEVH